MLTVTDKQRSKGTNDHKVKSVCLQISKLWDHIEDFERVFKFRIEKFPRLNAQLAQHSYRLVKPNDNTVEVWHLNTQSEPDRLLVEIVYKPETVTQ
jgi:hypothetical protein